MDYRALPERVEVDVLEPSDQHVDDDRAGDRAEQQPRRPAGGDAEPVDQRPGDELLRAEHLVLLRPPRSARKPGPRQLRPPQRRLACLPSPRCSYRRERVAAQPAADVPAGEGEEGRRDQQHGGERVHASGRAAPPRAPRSSRRSSPPSGRAGSAKKIRPSSGFGEKATEPVTIASMIASPRARAVASTAAATIAGRAARTLDRPQRAEAVDAERDGPVAPVAAAPPRSASTTIAIMIGVIITVRIRIPTPTLDPLSAMTPATDSFGAVGDDVVADEGDDHEDPDQPVDHRRHRGQQPHHRLEHPADRARARTRR